ncbi:MAG: hypothetical protein CMC65_07940 [Flavobacteriaceae bacterium]|nr:hypothetical protein [Flavobacteriaceae bacterium]|tara:strand:- start:5386 stop:7344 length:1959 start_codon:yes stop_codon:yes gene_type:complete
MAKFKKPILLQEEFAAGEVSSNPTTPAVKTSVDTVGTEQVAASKSGEQVRAEIVQDVDTILTNLEQLSKQITEDIDALINDLDNVFETFNEDFKDEAVNEDFMATMLQAMTDMKNYGALKSAYKPAATAVMNAEVTKVQKGAEFDSTAAVKTEEAEQKLKDKWNEKIKAEGQKHADNIPKKNKIQTKLRELRDEAVKSAVGGSIKKKVDAQKSKLNLAEDANIKKAQEKLGEITKDFPLSGEGLLAKQWNTEKNKIDLEIATKKIDLVTAAETEFLDDPDMIEKIEKRNADKLKKQEAEAKELAGKFKDDLATQEAKLAEQEAEALNDPKKKEAITAIKEYYGSAKEYLGVLGGVSAELTDEEKDAVVAARKKYNAAKDGFTAAKLKKTGDYTEDEATDEITNMTGSVDSAVKKFKDVVAKAEGAADDKKNKIKEIIADLKEELKTAKNDLEAAKTSAEGNMEDPGVVAAAKAVTDLEDKIKEQQDLLEDSVQIEETKDLNEGVHAKIKKAMKAVEDGETVYGENVRFPGRFKIVSFNKDGSMANVDYEDGTDAFDMAAMNIAIDKLQFEAVEVEETEEVEEGNEFGAARAEAIAKGEKTFKVGDEEYPVEDVSKDDKENAKEFVEEAKEELPKKIKLYEGMSVADRFKALM